MSEAIHYRFLVRGGTAANLAAVNEVPKHRELIVETDTGKIKLGNGSTPFNDLDYISGAGGAAWLNGAGAPAPALGEKGDYYLDTDTSDVYAKDGGAWAVVGNIKGDKGGKGDPSTVPGPPGPPGPSSSCFPTASFDGGTGAIQVGSWCEIFVPFGFEITRWTLVAQPLGNIVIDVRAAPMIGYPPTPSDTLCGVNAPRVIGDSRAQDATLTDWTTSVPSGSVVRFQVVACVGVMRAALVLEGARS